MSDTATGWLVRARAHAAELEVTPPAVPPAEAQPWCNFVVWTPQLLPAGCRLDTGTLRRQAPPGRVAGVTTGRTPWSEVNPVAYRYEVAGPGRRLRVKQFLYDWAFPALDHPCLWGTRAVPVPLDDTALLWIGVDYLGNRAASARLARTTVELSVLEGSSGEEEIVELYRSMRPADPAAAEAVAATPFAALSYWARYPDAAQVHVPVGLWTFRRRGRVHTGRWTAAPEEVRALLADHRLPPAVAGLAVDSVARFRDSGGRAEAEVVYAGGPRRQHELRLVVQRAGHGHLTFPPQPEKHPHSAAEVDVEGIRVQLAWVDDRYGPWDAVWRQPEAGLEAKLLASTAPTLDRAWFLGALSELVRSVRTEPR
ncbi:MAG: hypothetical protein ACJ73E_17330 [Mycobacteriales bacterium]